MNRLLFVIVLGVAVTSWMPVNGQQDADLFVTYVTPAADIKMFWKDSQGKILGSLARLKNFVERNGDSLVFAANGGMYKVDNSPQGLLIANGKTESPLDTLHGNGNFYLTPNGVFFIDSKHTAGVCETSKFGKKEDIAFATQSGPMLLIEGNIHPAFKKGSANLNIRNGVGILPDNRVVFAMSRIEINFYDFAMYFMSLGCKNALYLDGFVSRTYYPKGNSKQLDGNFGVIIGVVK